MNYNFSDRFQNLGGNAIREIFKLLANPEVISFAGGFPSAAGLPVEQVEEIVTELFKSDKIKSVLQYGGSEGYTPLRQSAIELVKRAGIMNADIDNTLIISGGQQGIDLTCKAFLNKGDTVLVESPTYLAVLHILKTYEANIVGVKSGTDGIDLDDLEAKIIAHKPKFIYLVPTFSNPTGRTLSLEKRKKLVDLIYKHGTLILEDDPYAELRFSGEKVPAIKSLDTDGRVIYVNSFSKTISPGLRVGICIAHEDIIRKLTIGKQATDVHTSGLSQAIVNEFLMRGLYQSQIDKLIPLYREKKELMAAAIKKYMPFSFVCTDPDGGLFIWGEFTNGIDASACFADAVNKTKVAYVPGVSFYADGSGKNTLRLNYSNSTNEQIERGMKALGEYFK
jgi:2-aminoadipate transaminase